MLARSTGEIVPPRRLSPPERDRLLAGRHVAALVTAGPDGTAAPTPIWYHYRDGLFYFRAEKDAVQTRNVRGDPRVSVFTSRTSARRTRP